YLLVGFLAVNPELPGEQSPSLTNTGLEAVLFYLVAYFITTLGAFGVLSVLSDPIRDAEKLEDYKGLDRKSTRLNSSHVKISYAVIYSLSLHDALPICYLLVGFLAVNPELPGEQSPSLTNTGLEAVLFYLVAYFITTLGAFGVLSVLSDPIRDAEKLEDYKG